MPRYRKTYVAETEADSIEEAREHFDDDGAEYGPTVDFADDTPVVLVDPYLDAIKSQPVGAATSDGFEVLERTSDGLDLPQR
jgi:hypothetical protein